MLDIARYCEGFAVGATGFEPATSSSQSWRSTRLSYAPMVESKFSCNQGTKKMARDGIEPPTRGFSIRCSTN